MRGARPAQNVAASAFRPGAVLYREIILDLIYDSDIVLSQVI